MTQLKLPLRSPRTDKRGKPCPRPETHIRDAAPDLYACVAGFLRNWPEFESGTDVSGADLVEWLSHQVPYWRDAVRRAEGRPSKGTQS